MYNLGQQGRSYCSAGVCEGLTKQVFRSSLHFNSKSYFSWYKERSMDWPLTTVDSGSEQHACIHAPGII